MRYNPLEAGRFVRFVARVFVFASCITRENIRTYYVVSKFHAWSGPITVLIDIAKGRNRANQIPLGSPG